MIRGIFFDASGVLYERNESTSRYAARLLAERGVDAQRSAPDGDRLNDLKIAAFDGRISPDAFWNEFLSLHGVALSDERAFLVKDILEQAHQVFALPGVEATLAALKRRGFVLGIVTDTMYPLAWKMEWLARVGVAEFIDVVACSTDVRAHKPDPAIYLHALNQARLTAAEAAFVGHDSRELDGAHQVGMVTVAVNYEPGTAADHHVQSLPDLLALPIFRRTVAQRTS